MSDPYSDLRFAMKQVSLAEYPPGATFGPRTLHDFEFVWVVSGEVVWEADGRPIPAPPGTMVLARPGMRDGFIWDPKRHTVHGFLHFSIESRGPGLPPESDWPLAQTLGDGDILRPLFRHLAWLQSRRPAGWEAHAQATLAQILVAFVSGTLGTVGDEVAGHPAIIDRVLEEVRKEWAHGPPRQIPLARLARLGGVSRAHLIRVFTRYLGVGPAEVLRLLRLDRAATLLARTNLPVQDIAVETGFANPFHFTRVFGVQYGCSPTAFRRRCAAGAPMPTTPLVRTLSLPDRLWR